MVTTKNEPTKRTVWQRIWPAIVLILIGLTFFLAQSSLWINTSVFNQQSFTSKTTDVLQTQSSRDAIASSVVDKALEDRPVASRLFSDQITSFVSNILGSDLASGAMTRIIDRSYAYFTSPDRQDIAIDLTGIKTPLSGIISFVENRGREVNFDPSNIPDQIVLLESDDFPDYSRYISLMVLLAGVAWFLFLGLSLLYIFISRDNRVRRTYHVLGVLAGVAIFALLTGPFIPPAVSSMVNSIPLRSVANDMAAAFLNPFGAQLWITLGILLIIFLIVFYRHAIVRGWETTVAAIRNRSSSH